MKQALYFAITMLLLTSCKRDEIIEKIDNTITLHWLQPVSNHDKAKTIVLYIDSKAHVIEYFRLQSGYNETKATYTFNFKYNLTYPYTIERIEFKDAQSQLIWDCDQPTDNQIYKTGDITLNYTSPVLIAGTYWTTANLTGTAGKFGDAANIKLCDNPQDLGMFFKWAATFVYDREFSATEGGGFNGVDTTGSSTTPIIQSKDYDYVNLNGLHHGDPCKKLGSKYKTPTSAQIKALYDTGNNGSRSYQNVTGWFFGPGATSATNTTIPTGCIFLPAAGFRYYGNGSFDGQGTRGWYWCSSVYDAEQGWSLNFDSGDNINAEGYNYRSYGFSVRCVHQ